MSRHAALTDWLITFLAEVRKLNGQMNGTNCNISMWYTLTTICFYSMFITIYVVKIYN